MKKMLPILLLCAALLLSACGKKQTEPQGSGSVEEPAAETGKSGKAPGKTAGKSADKTEKPGETPAGAASAQPTAKPTAKPATGGKTPASSPTATPTPKIETKEDVDEAQAQLLPVLSVNPVGNWTDSASGTQMVIDGDFHGSIVQTRADGTVAVWVFSGEYDPAAGVMVYSDGMKQEMTASGMKTAYQNSSGTLTVRDGALVWKDGSESQTITFQRDNG